jgi:hypothetical protein
VEGNVVLPIPKTKLAIKDHIAHYFVDCVDRTTRSKYGWIKNVDPFSIEGFLSKYAPTATSAEREHIAVMLESIDRWPEGTPIAATYSVRGPEHKVMAFTVHKIVFHQA